MVLRTSVATSLALSLATATGCGHHGSPSAITDPAFTPIACPAPTLVSGGTNPAVDPGATCLGAPRLSALPAASAATPHGWLDLGEHQVGQQVPFQVPAGTASLLLMEQWISGGPPGQQTHVTFLGDGSTQTQDNAAIIGELHDPSGHLIYTDLEVIGGADLSSALVVAVGAGSGVGSVAYPSSSAGLQAIGTAGVAPGTWTLMVNDYGYECWLAAQPPDVRPPGLAVISCDVPSQTSDTVYRVFVLTTAAASGGDSAIPQSALLDVAFHIVDAPTPIIGIDAASAPTNPGMRRMVASYGALLAGAGVCLGTVTFYDEPAWARSRFATGVSADDPTPCGNLPQLLATSKPGERTLELFLVPRLAGSSVGGAVPIGVDGTIPGPATVNGTVASGAVVSAEDFASGRCPAPGAPIELACGYDLAAYVAAHESGHFLGLYHVSEAAGDTFDPLDDTPHCECAACGLTSAACSQGLSPSQCLKGSARCSGGANLMFWIIGPGSVGFLSPEQARIVRSSPVVR